MSYILHYTMFPKQEQIQDYESCIRKTSRCSVWKGGDRVAEKIYKELVAIRKELQSIHRALEFAGNQTKMVEKTNVSILSATLARLCELFHVSADYMLFGKGGEL